MVFLFGKNYNLSPNAKSPASPNPGTMYDLFVNSWSTAPTQSVTFLCGKFFDK